MYVYSNDHDDENYSHGSFFLKRGIFYRSYPGTKACKHVTVIRHLPGGTKSDYVGKYGNSIHCWIFFPHRHSLLLTSRKIAKCRLYIARSKEAILLHTDTKHDNVCLFVQFFLLQFGQDHPQNVYLDVNFSKFSGGMPPEHQGEKLFCLLFSIFHQVYSFTRAYILLTFPHCNQNLIT